MKVRGSPVFCVMLLALALMLVGGWAMATADQMSSSGMTVTVLTTENPGGGEPINLADNAALLNSNGNLALITSSVQANCPDFGNPLTANPESSYVNLAKMASLSSKWMENDAYFQGGAGTHCWS